MRVLDWFSSAETEVQLLAASGVGLVLVGAAVFGLVVSAAWSRRQERAERLADLVARRKELAATAERQSRPPFGPGAKRPIPRWNNVTDTTVLLGAAKGGTR